MKDLQALVKAFPDPVIVISSNMKIVIFNEASRDLLDQPESGRALSHVTRNSALLEAAERTFRKGKKTSISFTLKKPFKRRVNATLIPLEHENAGDGANVRGTGSKRSRKSFSDLTVLCSPTPKQRRCST